jgi:hypothetical protein
MRRIGEWLRKFAQRHTGTASQPPEWQGRQLGIRARFTDRHKAVEVFDPHNRVHDPLLEFDQFDSGHPAPTIANLRCRHSRVSLSLPITAEHRILSAVWS